MDFRFSISFAFISQKERLISFPLFHPIASKAIKLSRLVRSVS